jgi:hypothetical protein
MDKLVIDMGDFNLVTEKHEGVEFIIYFQDKKTDCVTQDIATVRRTLEDGEVLPNAVECIVWTDEDSEDYTHKFVVNQSKEVA